MSLKSPEDYDLQCNTDSGRGVEDVVENAVMIDELTTSRLNLLRESSLKAQLAEVLEGLAVEDITIYDSHEVTGTGDLPDNTERDYSGRV